VFDTIAGLPVHPLAVHVVVVLLPLMSVVTVAVAVRPAWRAKAAVWVVAADAAVLVCSLVARQSGMALQRRLSSFRTDGVLVAADHGGKGAVLPWFALGLLVAAALVWWTCRRPLPAARAGAMTTLVTVLAVVAGAAAIGWTVVVGDAGARAVWGSTVSSSR
jgi:hypothetical protein